MACLRCGNCCLSVGIGLGALVEDRSEEAADVRRFHELHGFRYQKDGRNMLIQARCDALAMADGKAVCVIYADRPAICREYLCAKARGAGG